MCRFEYVADKQEVIQLSESGIWTLPEWSNNPNPLKTWQEYDGAFR